MSNELKDVALRIKALREMMDISVEEMAKVTNVSVADYKNKEDGNVDLSFNFMYNCAKRFGVSITEIMIGEAPKLTSYSIERKGEGLPLKRRAGFEYKHKASLFKDRIAEPFYVTAPFNADEQNVQITLSSHKGQEFDFILKGSLKVSVDGHIEVLNEGDSIYYDSIKPHGMIATNDSPCEFLAFVINEK
ncbi:MAG: XRE family transcriptional regulator [Clostridia bacterium]